MRRAGFWFALVVAVCLVTDLAAQRVLHVPAEFQTIQAAIDAAQNADVVLVAPGTYKECIGIGRKAITVRSSGGAAVTVIDGEGKGCVVSLGDDVGPQTILDGFTITGGTGGGCRSGPCIAGGGIYCSGAPTIINNVIVGNRASAAEGFGFGGGIYAEGTPTVARNVITGNLAAGGQWCFDPPYCPPWDLGYARGGGIWASGGTFSDNLVYGNEARLRGVGSCEGAGIYIEAPCVFANNTVYENKLTLLLGGGRAGAAGVEFGDGNAILVNSIVWNNIGGIQVGGSSNVSYCCIGGGYPGYRNISADPLLVDPLNGDFHLQYDSPCRDSGDAASTRSARDFEGDPRIADGGADMGADEFYAHLYHTGNATPGGEIRVKVIGRPGENLVLAVSRSVLAPPAPIPGLYGLLHLNLGEAMLFPLGGSPANGVTTFRVPFAPNFPELSFPTQALVGLQLSNPDVVHVR